MMIPTTEQLLFHSVLSTPIGLVSIVANDIGLTQVVFIDETTAANHRPDFISMHSRVNDNLSTEKSVTENAITRQAKSQLQEYFLGERTVFSLPLDPTGTPFQHNIWRCLSATEYGHTYSYKDIALMANNPKAVRAVGAANGKNPLGIIVPCHRIIGSNGTLTGYAGGLSRKSWLLQHESGEQKIGDLLTDD